MRFGRVRLLLVLWAAVVAATSVAVPSARAFRGADGEVLADTGDSSSLVAIAPDGSGNRPLGDGASGSWSPVGSQVVFEMGGGDVALMRSDGSGRTPLTSGEALDGEPSWSPDGDRIVFVREDPVTGARGLHVLRLGGGTAVPIVDAAVSPSGRGGRRTAAPSSSRRMAEGRPTSFWSTRQAVTL